MGDVRDQLIFKALVALDEAVDQCGAGPLKPGFALRFALAYLFAVSDGQRDSYDGFWHAIQEPNEREPGSMGSYIRSSAARRNLNGIARSVGLYLSVELDQALSHARKPKEDRHRIEEHERRLEAHRYALRDGSARAVEGEEELRRKG